MLKVPNCEICKQYLEQTKIKKMCCNAFPDGIPLDVIVKAEPGVECAPGYSFEEKDDDRVYHDPPADGFYSRMMKLKNQKG